MSVHSIILSMQWIHHYHLFLFDFDGILVNTEHLHYRAYLKVCSNRGFCLDWDEKTYMRHAMYTATGVKEGIYRQLPDLEKMEPCWAVLYSEKKKVYSELIEQGVALMPGVEELLIALEGANIKRCIVTHAPREQVELICKQHPILNTIPEWFTRENYSQPKPSSECYKKAISKLGEAGDCMVGFEDSPRGLKALLETEAKAVFVNNFFEISEIKSLAKEVNKGFVHLSSLTASHIADKLEEFTFSPA